ncbi:MAG TPA: TolC family protein [Saprospiraceae bacterium]|nr:TolC family protein [Saprospiraceae bacterium]
MIRKITLWLVFIPLSWALRAQDAMSLADCIDYAMTNHTDIRVAQLTIKDADWQIKENRAAAYPHFDLGLSATHFLQQPALPAEAFGFGDPGTKLKFALKTNLSGKISYNQLLFNSSYLVSIKAAKMYRDYVGLQLAAVQERVRNQVEDAYLPALVVTESINVLDKNIENQEKLFNEVKATYKAGFVEQLDVDRVEYILSTLKTERESQVRQRDILLDALKFAMNKPIKEELTLSDDIDKLLTAYGDINPDEDLDYMTRPAYVALIKARELSQVQVEVYQKDWMPTLSFFASYDPSYQGNNKLFWIPSSIFGFSVSMPIYDGGLSKAKEERAVISALQVDEQKNTLTRAMDLELDAAKKQFANAKLKLADQQHNMELAQRIHDTAQAKFKQGVGSSFEVTQADSEYYQAQALLISARFEYLKSIVGLKKALGKS